MIKCELCQCPQVTFQDEFQTLCRRCHLQEIIKENDYFLDHYVQLPKDF